MNLPHKTEIIWIFCRSEHSVLFMKRYFVVLRFGRHVALRYRETLDWYILLLQKSSRENVEEI